MIAPDIPVPKRRNAFSFETHFRVGLRTCFYLILHFPIHCFDTDRAAQRRFGEGDRYGGIDARILAFEYRMRGYDYFYKQIAPFASIDTWLSVAPVAQALAIIDTGRNCNLDFLSPGDKTGSIAVRTFFFDNLAGTAAVRTGLNILDLGTGKEQHITITSGSNMSDSDIDKAVKEAAEYEAQDKKRKEAIDTRNDADSIVFQTEKALEEVGDKIDANDKAVVEADLNALKEAINKAPIDQMTDAQVDEIKAGKEKLMASAQALFAKVYEAAQGAAGAQGGPQPGPDMGAGAPHDDNVVDGDFKEV